MITQKRVQHLKQLPEEICPIYSNISNYWTYTLSFVEQYINGYYEEEFNSNDEYDDEDQVDKLLADKELNAFYEKSKKYFNIASKFRYKKFNIINLLAHFICNATIWDNHLKSCVSFNYSIDPDFTGLKIIDVKGGSKRNTIQTFAEYCLCVLSQGWNMMKFDGSNNGTFENNEKLKQKMKETSGGTQFIYDIPWSDVVLDDDKIFENKKIFNEYFKDNMEEIIKQCEKLNKTSIAPYNAMNPKYLSSSAML